MRIGATLAVGLLLEAGAAHGQDEGLAARCSRIGSSEAPRQYVDCVQNNTLLKAKNGDESSLREAAVHAALHDPECQVYLSAYVSVLATCDLISGRDDSNLGADAEAEMMTAEVMAERFTKELWRSVPKSVR